MMILRMVAMLVPVLGIASGIYVWKVQRKSDASAMNSAPLPIRVAVAEASTNRRRGGLSASARWKPCAR